MNTKFSKGLRYTGVGGIMCGRSEMIMPTGVGNLQKGEKYGFEKILRRIVLIFDADMQIWTILQHLSFNSSRSSSSSSVTILHVSGS
jgi:hypothetical protein